jgi:hypothetical protein
MLLNEKYDYDYPDGLDLQPGSETHEKIIQELTTRAKESRGMIGARRSDWESIDKSLTAYEVLDKDEKKVYNNDFRKPVRIVVPTTYATLQILLSYMSAAFLQSPIFRFEPWGDEDVAGTALLERVVEVQSRRFKAALRLYLMWRDAFAYGIGPVALRWTSKKRRVWGDDGVGGRIPQDKFIEGTELLNIDPYNFLPDTTVPIDRLQDGEFVGWGDRTTLAQLLQEEADANVNGDPTVFNAQYVKDIGSRRLSQYFEDPPGRRTRTGQRERRSPTPDGQLDTVTMYVKVVPSEWELGPSDEPETWIFSMVGDKILTRAERLDAFHGMFPVAVDVPNVDGHTITPTSILETSMGLQKTIDFMFTSHVANVRKAINDMLIVDPFMVNVNDLKNPSEGKIIRLRSQAWGRGVENVVQQLNVTDITQNHINDIMTSMNLMDLSSGAVDAVKGVRRRTSERVSATEAQGVMSSALSRLETTAMISGMQAHADIATIMACNTQQYMNREERVKIEGDMAEQLVQEYGYDSYAKVSPDKLQVGFDVMPHDGTTPSSTDTQSWIQLFQIMAAQPELGAQFDMARIFKHVARAMGARNVNDFIQKGGNVQTQVAPDDQVDQQAQLGNLAPLGGGAL